MNVRVLSSGRFRRFLCVLLSAVMTAGPCAMAIAQTPRGAAPSALAQPALTAAATARIDTTYIDPDADAVIVLRPAQIMASPHAAMLPIEVASAAGIKYLGFDPANVEEAIVFVKQPRDLEPQDFALTIKFIQPFQGSDIAPAIREYTQLGELAGRRYLQSPVPMLPSFFAPDAKTLVVAPDATLRRLVGARPAAPGAPLPPLMQRVRLARGTNDFYAAVDVAKLRDTIQSGLAGVQMMTQGQLPPEAAQFFDAPNLVSAVELTLNPFSAVGRSSLVVHANDPQSGQRLEAMVGDAIKMYQEQTTAQVAQELANSDDPVEKALAAYMQRVSGQSANMLRPERRGQTLTFFRTEGDAGKQQLATTAISGVLVALLLPAVQAARESARRNQSMNQMKQLVLGVLNHESAKQALPAHANYDANGKPLLSWRVHILPYVDGEALYREFHLDEPWDSAHNRALIPRMPAVYANPSLPFPPTEGKTNYLAVVGAGLAMNGTAEGVTLPQMTDGTSSTVVIVEADAERAVEWTRPDDLQFNSADPTAGLGGLRPGGFQAAYCDGHVEFVSDFMPPEMIAGMFTIAGGERIDTMHFEMTSPFNLGNQPGIDPNEFFGAGERGGRPAATEDMEDMSRGRGSVPIDQGDRGRDTSMDDMPRDREGNLIDQGERGRGTPLDDVPRDREGNPIDQGDRGRGGPTDDLPRD